MDTVIKNSGSGGLLTLLLAVLTGLLPLAAGTLVAGVAGFPLRPGVAVMGGGVLAALILAAAAAREAFSPEAVRFPGFRFLSPLQARGLGYGLVALAALLGLLLQSGLHTGRMTLPLVALGILGGYGYFAPPVKLGRRGGGEALGALCLGLGPVFWGFYLQCGHLMTEPLLYGLPLSLAAFNLLLVHGLPVPGGAGPAEPSGLAGKLRPVSVALIFTLANILVIAALVFDLLFPGNPLPFRAGFMGLIILAVVNQEVIKRKAYLREEGIRLLCRLSLALHLAMGLVFIISLRLR
jgi:hypothetical protein